MLRSLVEKGVGCWPVDL